MPDGDRIHSRLASIYQKPYMQLCEGHYKDEELAIEVLRSVKADLEKNGSESIELIRKIVALFEQIPPGPLLKESFNWVQISETIDKLAFRTHGNQRPVSLAVRACKDYLNEIRYNECSRDFLYEVTRRYMLHTYIANFEKRILPPEFNKNVTQVIIDKRVTCIQPHVIKGIDALSMQVARKCSFKGLRLPRRQKAGEAINLDTDLLRIAV